MIWYIINIIFNPPGLVCYLNFVLKYGIVGTLILFIANYNTVVLINLNFVPICTCRDMAEKLLILAFNSNHSLADNVFE